MKYLVWQIDQRSGRPEYVEDLPSHGGSYGWTYTADNALLLTERQKKRWIKDQADVERYDVHVLEYETDALRLGERTRRQNPTPKHIADEITEPYGDEPVPRGQPNLCPRCGRSTSNVDHRRDCRRQNPRGEQLTKNRSKYNASSFDKAMYGRHGEQSDWPGRLAIALPDSGVDEISSAGLFELWLRASHGMKISKLTSDDVTDVWNMGLKGLRQNPAKSMMTTKKEMDVLRRVAQCELRDPPDDLAAQVYLTYACETKSDAAVVGSLIKKGLVGTCGLPSSDPDATIWLTDHGIRVWTTRDEPDQNPGKSIPRRGSFKHRDPQHGPLQLLKNALHVAEVNIRDIVGFVVGREEMIDLLEFSRNLGGYKHVYSIGLKRNAAHQTWLIATPTNEYGEPIVRKIVSYHAPKGYVLEWSEHHGTFSN